MERQLILSRIQTPDGTILTSYHQHDYVTHLDKNGEEYMLDGGNSYQRYNITKEPFTDLSIYSDAPFEIIRENFYRGGRGKDGKSPLTWIKLSEMNNEWLKNCIEYNRTLGYKDDCYANERYREELQYRRDNNIFIEDKDDE